MRAARRPKRDNWRHRLNWCGRMIWDTGVTLKSHHARAPAATVRPLAAARTTITSVGTLTNKRSITRLTKSLHHPNLKSGNAGRMRNGGEHPAGASAPAFGAPVSFDKLGQKRRVDAIAFGNGVEASTELWKLLHCDRPRIFRRGAKPIRQVSRVQVA